MFWLVWLYTSVRCFSQLNLTQIKKKMATVVANYMSRCFNDNRMWAVSEPKGLARTTAIEAEKLKLISEACDTEAVSISNFFFWFK